MRNVLAAGAVMVTFTAAVAAAAPQAASHSAKEGVYTAAQAARGKALYTERCAECHGAITAVFPELATLLGDHVFQTKWRDRSLAELFDRVRDTMPQNKPRTLSADQTVDLIAYILSGNGLPAGDVPLPEDVETLKQIRMDAGLP